MKKIPFRNKITIVLFFLIISSSSSYAQFSKLEEEINFLLSNEFFSSSQIAVDIYDLTCDKPLYSKNEKLLLRPASTLKLLTTSTALLFLNDFKFNTSFYYNGAINDSILFGNLFVVGGLDPEFSLKDLDSIVSEIRKTGIKEIHGHIIADVSSMDSLFWGNGWMWDDDPEPFSPYLSPLNINKNSIKITFEPNLLNCPAIIKLVPKTNFVEIINNSITKENKNTPFKITRDWINRTNKILVEGELSFNESPGEVSLNIFNPTAYFLILFKESLERNKISFNGEIKISKLPNEVSELFIFSRSIDSIIENTNKNSDNLNAEMILRALSLKYYGKPASAEKGIKLIDSLITLAGNDPKLYKIVDGSGLSFYNLISTELLIQVLKYIYKNNKEAFINLFNSLPIAGIDGTLKDRMKESPVFSKVRAKTGTLSGVNNICGFLLNESNHLIAFSVLIQNFTGSSKFARQAQEKICEIIYSN